MSRVFWAAVCGAIFGGLAVLAITSQASCQHSPQRELGNCARLDRGTERVGCLLRGGSKPSLPGRPVA